MFAALNRTVDATSEPLTTEEAKKHIRVDHGDDDTYIESLIKAARINAEDFCSRAFIEQTWVATYDCLDGARLRLPRPKLISVSSVQYIDSNGDLQTVNTSDYEVNTYGEPGNVKFKVIPGYDATYENPLRVTYKSGYGTQASNVPTTIKHAILLMVGHWYEMREAVISPQGNDPKELPLGMQHLLNPYRFYYS